MPFNEYRGRSVLITGGAGFIGSNLARRLVELGGVRVHVLDALLPGGGGNLHNLHEIAECVSLHTGDLRDEGFVAPLVAGADVVFNLAAAVGHVDSVRRPLHDLELNCAAQLSLLNACRDHNPGVKVVYTSTRQVYGCPEYLPLDEKHPVAPRDVNGIHKLAAEQYHLLYRRLYGVRAVCLRLTNTYGPRQYVRDDRQGVIGSFIRRAVEGGTIELFGDGEQRRDLNYVDDVVEALLLAGSGDAVEGETFNLGADAPVTLRELAEALVSLTGRGSVRHVPFPAERGLIDIGNSHSSYRKIESALGWRPRTPLHEGLARTIEFYRGYGAHYWPR